MRGELGAARGATDTIVWRRGLPASWEMKPLRAPDPTSADRPSSRRPRAAADVVEPVDASDLSDGELLAAVADGDREAYRQLFEHHAGSVLSVLRRLCGDETLADDLLQDVFLLLWRKASSFDRRRGDFGGWIYVLCRNRVADHFRRSEPSSATASATSPFDSQTLAPTDMPHRDLQLALTQSIARLRTEERDVVRETYFSGRTYDEAALRLEIPLGTLKSRLRSALKKLSKGLTS